MRLLTFRSRPILERRHHGVGTVALTLSLALGACAQAPAPGARVAVVSAPLEESPCGATGPISAPPQDVVIAPSVDHLLADMRAQQAINDCKRVDGAPVPNPGPAVLARPTQLAIQTQTPAAAAVVPVDEGGRHPAIPTQNATQAWVAAQQILNRPNTDREAQALYVSLCKSGDRSSCLMAQAFGQQSP